MEDTSLIRGRERRTTAGNRLQKLLAGEFTAEEEFMEVENDDDFVGKDEHDVFDEDFEETDEDEAQEDDLAGEQALRKEEASSKKVSRLKLKTSGTFSRLRLKLKANASSTAHDTPSKNRRVSMGLAVDAETGEPMTRTSQRRATVLHTLGTKSRLREADEKKASLPKRKKAPLASKTQDALIREALELEERNVASLKHFLSREEEKKKQARVVRAKVSPPLLRWISRIEDNPQPLVQLLDGVGLSAPQPTEAPPAEASSASISQVCSLAVEEFTSISLASSPRENSGTPRWTAPNPVPATPPPIIVVLPATPAASTALQDVPMSSQEPRITDPMDATATDDRVHHILDKTDSTRQARNYVVLELASTGKRMSDEEALFCGHRDWSRAAEARREQLRERVSAHKNPICPLSGLPALYIDPRSGVPYATAKKYQVLTKLLNHEYVWSQDTGCYTNEANDKGAKGTPAGWDRANATGGAAAAVIQPKFVGVPPNADSAQGVYRH